MQNVPSIRPDALSKAADLASELLKPAGGNDALVPRGWNRQDNLVTSTITWYYHFVLVPLGLHVGRGFYWIFSHCTLDQRRGTEHGGAYTRIGIVYCCYVLHTGQRAYNRVCWREAAYCKVLMRQVVTLDVQKYRVIHKSLRDFRTRLRNNQDRHGRKEHINR